MLSFILNDVTVVSVFLKKKKGFCKFTWNTIA